jgi:hypothetical protein
VITRSPIADMKSIKNSTEVEGIDGLFISATYQLIIMPRLQTISYQGRCCISTVLCMAGRAAEQRR